MVVAARVAQVAVLAEAGALRHVHDARVEVAVAQVERHDALDQVVGARAQVTEPGLTVVVPLTRAPVVTHIACGTWKTDTGLGHILD